MQRRASDDANSNNNSRSKAVVVDLVSDEEKMEELLDPSNPAAHKQSTTSVTKDTTVDAPTTTTESKIKLSSWASRFLTPRKIPVVLDEMPIEPMQDYILKDMGTRSSTDFPNLELLTEENDDDVILSEQVETPFSVGIPVTHVPDENEIMFTSGKSEKSSSGPPPSSGKKNHSEPSRYFRMNLSVKCFNCGEVGHMSGSCVNARKARSCMYCGVEGHESFSCPDIRCFSCFRKGHQQSECPNTHINVRVCAICGHQGHNSSECSIEADDFTDVRCMVCLTGEHSTCMAPRPAVPEEVYCPKCAGSHSYSECHRPMSRHPVGYRTHYSGSSSSRNNYQHQRGNNTGGSGYRPHNRNYSRNSSSSGGNRNSNSRSFEKSRKQQRSPDDIRSNRSHHRRRTRY